MRNGILFFSLLFLGDFSSFFFHPSSVILKTILFRNKFELHINYEMFVSDETAVDYADP